MYSRVKTPRMNWAGWVGLVRNMRPVTLFGKGFGELLEPDTPPLSEG